MPEAFIGWLLVSAGVLGLLSSVKNQKMTDVIAHALNPSVLVGKINQGVSSTGTATGLGGTATGLAVSGGVAKALAYCEAQQGKPYLWGATGPNAFDCSGLMYKACQQAGVTLPRTSLAQYAATRGHEIPIGSGIPAGALVFFGKSKLLIHHVAMATGLADQMIEAPQTGDVVKKASISAEGDLIAVTTPLAGT